MSIYTGIGDEGTTSHPHFGRITKDSALIEVNGLIDRATVEIGGARASLASRFPEVDELLLNLQQRLFSCAHCLYDANKGERPLSLDDINKLEEHIDHFDSQLPPLKNFVIPGGSAMTIAIHRARLSVRDTERAFVGALSLEGVEGNPLAAKFLNRLSDLLFVLSRYVLIKNGLKEIHVDTSIG